MDSEARIRYGREEQRDGQTDRERISDIGTAQTGGLEAKTGKEKKVYIKKETDVIVK